LRARTDRGAERANAPVAVRAIGGLESKAMRILAANHSSFPSPAGDSTAISSASLRLQEECDLDIVSDGARGGAALVHDVMEGLDGVRPGEPTRAPFFAQSFRKPRVQAKLRRRHPILAPRFRALAEQARRPLKAVLCGPYTAAHLSQIETTAYSGAAALAAELSIVLAEEVRSLVESGARLVQIDEPLILRQAHDIRFLRELLEPLQTAVEPEATLAVSIYGADAEPHYAQLCSLPGDLICFDCTRADGLVEVIAATGAGKPLALGLVDGRAPVVESAASRAALLERALRRYEHDVLHVQPSCGMESLGVDGARAKLALLVELRRHHRRA
jgi:methionine synthase II (cobalamin-independent)